MTKLTEAIWNTLMIVIAVTLIVLAIIFESSTPKPEGPVRCEEAPAVCKVWESGAYFCYPRCP